MAAALVPLPQLQLDGYRATTFDYDPPPPPPAADDASSSSPKMLPGKLEWVEVFRKSTAEFKKRAAGDTRVEGAAALAETFAADFNAGLDLVLAGDHAALFEAGPCSCPLVPHFSDRSQLQHFLWVELGGWDELGGFSDDKRLG